MGLFLTRLFTVFFGKVAFQKIFKWLYHFSLYGLNYANVASVEASGEKFLLKKIKNQKPKGSSWLLFDIGANRGEYSELILSEFKGENITVHAFEPSTPCRQLLNEKFKNITSIQIHPFGVGEKPSQMELYYDTETSGLASVFPRRDYSQPNTSFQKSEAIHIITLDDFCDEQGIEYIDFLKIDIEGNEYFAFKGAQKLLNEKRIHRIQFEFGDGNIESRTYLRDFYDILSPNYRIYRVVQNGLVELKRYIPTLEVFLGANYYAELRP